MRPIPIHPEVASEYLIEGRAIFLDARPREERERAGDRIPGAVDIDGSGAELDGQLAQLPRERVLIAYCDAPAQAESSAVARRLRELGHGDGFYVDGGFTAWKEAELPTERRWTADGAAVAGLAGVSTEELAKLCRLAYWLGVTEGAYGDWGEERAELTAYLTELPGPVLQRFRRFLDAEPAIGVPDDHLLRLQNLPEVVRQVALRLARGARGHVPLEALAGTFPADDSALLLRWFTWTEEIPRRAAWWHTPHEELRPTND